MMVDGVEFADQTCVVAMVISVDGTKGHCCVDGSVPDSYRDDCPGRGNGQHLAMRFISFQMAIRGARGSRTATLWLNATVPSISLASDHCEPLHFGTSRAPDNQDRYRTCNPPGNRQYACSADCGRLGHEGSLAPDNAHAFGYADPPQFGTTRAPDNNNRRGRPTGGASPGGLFARGDRALAMSCRPQCSDRCRSAP